MFAVSPVETYQTVRRSVVLPLCGLALFFAAGCGGDDSGSAPTSSSKPAPAEPAPAVAEPTPAAEPAPAESEPTETAATETPAAHKTESKPAADAKKKSVDPNATGGFVGSVVLDGDAPTLAPLVEKGSETVKDKEVCAAEAVPDESLIVGEGNGIANVFIYLRRAPKGYKSEAPSEPVVLDQKGCVFTPHVALIQAGQKVVVKSSDAIQHNIHTFPERNQGTNLLIKANDQEGVELAYPKAESEPLQVKCDIHAFMSSWHLVLDHPFMALTDANGKFQIDGLPAGDYEFRVWHERGGLLEKGYKVTITGDDEPTTLKYTPDQFKS
ncbi:MAG: carboxypeptidase regulatory-like domain-containing protein [Planctomycetaceae bacterium]